jgi:uroporphyrinogen-III synthase
MQRVSVRLLVTRPQPQADAWVAQLQAVLDSQAAVMPQGDAARVRAVAMPLLAIQEAPDAAAVQAAWAQLVAVDAMPSQAFNGVMFVSPAAVDAWMAAKPAQATWPVSTWVAVPGPGTERAFRAHGMATRVREVLGPKADAAQFDSEALWAAIGHRPWSGQRILIVHGGAGRELMAQRWRDAGASVQQVQAYQRGVPRLDAAQQAALQQAMSQPKQHLWLFSSGEAAGHLAALAPGAPWHVHTALCTHPTIAERATTIGFGTVQVCSPEVKALAQAARRLALDSAR